MNEGATFGFYCVALSCLFVPRGLLLRAGVVHEPLQASYFDDRLSLWHRNTGLAMVPVGVALVVVGCGLIFGFAWLTVAGIAAIVGGVALALSPPVWLKPQWLRVTEAGGDSKSDNSLRWLSRTVDLTSWLAFLVIVALATLTHNPSDLGVWIVFGVGGLLNYLSRRRSVGGRRT